MKALKNISLLFAALLLINCSGDDDKPSPTQNAPSTPVGLTAQPSGQQVILTWDENTETDLSHYNIYQGTSDNSLEKVDEVAAGTNTYIAGGLNNDTTYYFAVDAENTSGYKSAQSSTVSASPSGLTVYVAGHINIGENSVATVWKNGTAQSLTDGSSKAYAWSVFVYGDDVYVAGHTYNGSISVATLWKNGTAQYLSDGSSYAQATSVYVTEGVVYVAGHENYEAKIWRNGTAHFIADGTNSRAHSVFVSNGHIYAAGYEHNEDNMPVAVLWDNYNLSGYTAYYLTDGSGSAYARAVVAYEGDTYVAGFKTDGENGVARLWKNQNELPQYTNSSNNAAARWVYISEGDVYIAGGEKHDETNHNMATQWINGTAQHLTDGTSEAYAYSIYVNDGDVYVAGSENSNSANSVAKLWINGTPQTLSSNNAAANSVVVKHD